jgi:hypothetical protein
MNPNRTRDMTAALTTGGVIKTIMLGLVAHIDHYTPRVIQFSGNLIGGYKASVTECDFKCLWRSVMRCGTH